MASTTESFSTWGSLTTNTMTSLFLYGARTPPQDLNERVKDPTRSVTVVLNRNDFMSSGPGRYANPSQVPFVQTLFSPALLGAWMQRWGIANQSVMTIGQVKALILSSGGTLGDFFTHVLQQYRIDTGSADYAQRTYIYNSEKFDLADSTTVVFDVNQPGLINVALTPQPEDFDFVGGGRVVNILNTLAKPFIDPQKLGVTVDITFDGSAVPVRNAFYTAAIFATDGVAHQAIESSEAAGAVGVATIATSILSQLSAGGVTEYERAGRKIVYGSVGNDVLAAGSVSGVTRIGTTSYIAVGGAGNDVIGTDGGDDILIGGSGRDTLQGGTGNDEYRYVTGESDDVIIDADGLGRITVNGAALTGATKPFYFDGLNRQTWDSVDGNLTYMVTGGNVQTGGTLQISGSTLGGATITVQNFKLNQLGLQLNTTKKVALNVDPGNVNPINSASYAPQTASGDIGERGAKIVKGFLSGPASSGDVLSISASNAQGLYVVDGAQTHSLSSGNVQIALTPGQTEVVFLVWSKDTISTDQTATINATWVGADGVQSSIGALALTVHNANDPTDPIQEPATTNSIIKTGDDENITDTAANDYIDGMGGNDTITASAGDDWVYGGAGNDNIKSGAGNNHVLGGFGNDTVQGGSMLGQVGNDVVEGNAGADIVYGNAGDDRVYGEDYIKLADAITQGETASPGSGQGDFVGGGMDNDTVVGSNRGDLLTGGIGNDVLVGGGGDDILESDNDYGWVEPNWTASVVVNNSTYTFTVTGATSLGNGIGVAMGDDRVYAGAGNDGVRTGPGMDVIDAGTGNDTVFGDGGEDQMLGGDGNDVLVGDNSIGWIPVGEHGADFIDGGQGDDLAIGNGGNDALFGGDGNDTMVGDGGGVTTPADDYLNGEAGNDQLFGSLGNDTVLGGADNDILVGDNGGTETVGGADFIEGGLGNDQLFGQAGDDTLRGGEGMDTLQGDLGVDQLDGGVGVDSLRGGAGNDWLAGGADGDWVQGDADSDFADGGAGADTVLGGSGDDTVLGGEGTDWLQGDAGNDFAEGGAGADTMLGGGGGDQLAGGDDNDYMQGDVGDDQLDGGNGVDVLVGGMGADALTGGAGDDQLVGDNGGVDLAGDSDVLDAGDGNDQVWGQGGNDLIVGGLGNDTLSGGQGFDALVGGGGNDAYAYNLGDGIDRIEDSDGTDYVVFGPGIYFADLGLGLGSLQINIPGGGELHIEGFDPEDPYGFTSIEFFRFADGSQFTYAQLLSKGFTIGGTPDADYLVGTAINDSINGLASDDVLKGEAGDDELSGDAGSDTIYGGSGADHLDGGDGDDVLAGNTGMDMLEGGAGDDVYQFSLGDGKDTVVDAAGADVISFGVGISSTNISAGRQGNDLLLAVLNTSDSLTIKDWFVNDQTVSKVFFNDGTTLDRAGISDLMRNAAPVLMPDAVSVQEDGTLTASGNALANDIDPEGRVLRVTNPGSYAGTYGTLTLGSNGAYGYTLNNAATTVQALTAGQTAVDTFTYIATDDDPAIPMGSGSSISVNITGTNDAPIVVADSASAAEDQTTAITGNVLANDRDVDAGAVLRVDAPGTYTSQYGTLSIASDGAYSFALANATPAVQGLAEGATVVDHFTYTASDSIVSTPSALNITITGRNDAPVLANSIADTTTSANSSFSLQLPAGTFTDADAGDVLTWSATMADGTALPSWLTFDALTHTFSGRVPRTATGSLDLLVAATDRSGARASEVFNLAFAAGSGGGGGGGGGGGNGSGGNEGVGNGEDAPPPGHDDSFNDGPGTGPGNPGAQGGTNGNGNTPHAVGPIGAPPGALLAALVGEAEVAAPSGHSAEHGNGQVNNNGNHNGEGNGGGNASAPEPSTSSGDPLAAPAARQAKQSDEGSLERGEARPSYDFGAVARHLDQSTTPDGSILTARQIARQWRTIANSFPALGTEDELHDVASESRGMAHDSGTSGWGYAGSTGSNGSVGGLPAFTGLSEGFGKLG